MSNSFGLQQIEQAIASAKPDQQQQLLRDLPHLLKIHLADLSLLKAAEPSFDFWNNPDDLVYDRM